MFPDGGLTHVIIPNERTVLRFPDEHALPIAAGAYAVTSREPRTEDAVGSDSSSVGTNVQRPSASLTIEATDSEEFVLLKLESPPPDVEIDDVSDGVRPESAAHPGPGASHSAPLGELPDLPDPSKPGEIP